MTHITLAVIDMAGTTVRDGGVVEQAVRLALEQTVGKEAVIERQFAQRFSDARGASKLDMFRSIIGNEEQAQRAHACFEAGLECRIRADAVTPLPGAYDTLTRLRDDGVAVALITGFSRRVRDALLDQLGWHDAADLVLSPEDAGRGRPSPDLVLTAVLRLGITAVQEVAVAGDTANDLIAGARAGATLLAGVLNGAHTRAQLEQAPHTHILESVEQLPDAIRDFHP